MRRLRRPSRDGGPDEVEPSEIDPTEVEPSEIEPGERVNGDTRVRTDGRDRMGFPGSARARSLGGGRKVCCSGGAPGGRGEAPDRRAPRLLPPPPPPRPGLTPSPPSLSHRPRVGGGGVPARAYPPIAAAGLSSGSRPRSRVVFLPPRMLILISSSSSSSRVPLSETIVPCACAT